MFYQGIAAGSFTLTNAVTDSDAGPFSSTTSDLAGDSAGWAHAPATVVTPAGGPYVSQPFSWSPGTTSAPSLAVTGRDVAGNSATTKLKFVNDSSAPTAGTISYRSGYQPDESVTVTFTSGTDSGSGIATRQLQSSAASLDSGTCGAFGAFTDVGANNPTSPYTDSQVDDQTCYQYRYVVTDQVSNRDIATSTAVAVVAASIGGPALRTGSVLPCSLVPASSIGWRRRLAGTSGRARAARSSGSRRGLSQERSMPAIRPPRKRRSIEQRHTPMRLLESRTANSLAISTAEHSIRASITPRLPWLSPER